MTSTFSRNRRVVNGRQKQPRWEVKSRRGGSVSSRPPDSGSALEMNDEYDADNYVHTAFDRPLQMEQPISAYLSDPSLVSANSLKYIFSMDAETRGHLPLGSIESNTWCQRRSFDADSELIATSTDTTTIVEYLVFNFVS